nr:hypothetical protein Iba_scaffold40593CG0010 [Ipomoea batatas]GMD92556.1 hypothetical protein Iba_chr14eCG10270 [Ipomoea batatas]GME06351.1 hypothetical protein Iba_scaffold3997CG0520 [Ipomoea batatas]GME20492.1 hypothetical protein Iba_scaffold25268CG0010 [Ipomoea batatas]
MSKATALTRPPAASSCFLTTSAASLSRRITTWRLIRRKSYRRARRDQRQGFLQVVGHHRNQIQRRQLGVQGWNGHRQIPF